MKTILNRLINNQTLSRAEAHQVLTGLATGQYNNSQIAAFLTVYLMRAISVDELQGFRDAMLDLCNPVDLDGFNAIDLCGTGGDGKNTFNMSTIASFIVAGAGVNVAKHGNYGVSSVSGSSNVLEYLGVTFSGDAQLMRRSVEEAGICFMHAPLFHPAMKHVAPIRRELGVKTFFNMLGPLVNPSFPPNQLVGVFNLELARLYSYLYQNTDKRYAIVHSLDGYDEISLTERCKLISNDSNDLLRPQDLGLPQYQQSDLHGGESIAEAAEIFTNILMGNGSSAQNDTVVVNAGIAIAIAQRCSFEDGIAAARDSLLSGSAYQALTKFITVNS